uniref:HECT domain-containing protein n=1 Tax=Labrus bergylta TaxID=56723 RepID=A0A3Q3G049_9LABR
SAEHAHFSLNELNKRLIKRFRVTLWHLRSSFVSVVAVTKPFLFYSSSIILVLLLNYSPYTWTNYGRTFLLSNLILILLLLLLTSDEVESEVEASGPQLTVEAFLQWITGQGHVPVLQEEKMRFKVNVKSEHHCESHFGEHRICYPNVAACIKTITFPVKHMTSFKDFKEVLVEAFHLAQEFSKV